MKKLDEIMELMSDEMADFKDNLNRLQALNKELAKQSIPICTAALDEQLQKFLQGQEKINQERDQAIIDIKSELNKSTIIPKYLLTLFAASLLLLIISLGYFMYSTQVLKKRFNELSKLKLELENEDYSSYFSQNPDKKEDFCRWLEEYHK